MMDDLLWRLRGSGCKVVAYADDLLLIVEGQSRVELERMGTEWMRAVYEWGVSGCKCVRGKDGVHAY